MSCKTPSLAEDGRKRWTEMAGLTVLRHQLTLTWPRICRKLNYANSSLPIAWIVCSQLNKVFCLLFTYRNWLFDLVLLVLRVQITIRLTLWNHKVRKRSPVPIPNSGSAAPELAGFPSVLLPRATKVALILLSVCCLSFCVQVELSFTKPVVENVWILEFRMWLMLAWDLLDPFLVLVYSLLLTLNTAL